jgi:hypothetical protein
MVFLGSTPIGGPIVGWVAEHVGPRWSVALGGAAGVGAAIYGTLACRGLDLEPREEELEVPVPEPTP